MNWKLLLVPLAAGSISLLFELTASSLAASTENSNAEGSPVFGVTLPPGYRDWQFVSLAHEEGKVPDIRVILGNDIAMRAFREGTLPFPDGAIIARLAYQHVSSPQNNAVFGREQSYIAGDPTNVQISVKDSKRYASTGGWGYGQFEDGKPNPSETLVNTCFACHTKLPPATDLVFTKYSK
ncbi:cytochrome P460 family protein [Pseudomonas sp. GB2N2]